MKNLIEKFKNCNVCVIGDGMLDTYLYGSVERISPEAPIPVISDLKEKNILGGAANVVNNIIDLGGKVNFITTLGIDNDGRKLYEMLKAKRNIKIDIFSTDPSIKRTIKKLRIIGNRQQIVRCDFEDSYKEFPVMKTWYKTFPNELRGNISQSDIVVISDYNKGFLSKESIEHIIKISKEEHKKIIVDTKNSNLSIYQGVDFITPNKKEISKIIDNRIDKELNLLQLNKIGEMLSKTYLIKNILITLGEDGLFLYTKKGFKYISAIKEKVFDVSGAGDTVLSIISLGMILNFSLEDMLKLAILCAKVSVSKPGTATVSQDELQKEINEYWDKLNVINNVYTL